MNKLLFLALLGFNFTNAQFKVSVFGNPNLTSVYNSDLIIRDYQGNTLDSKEKSGYGYSVGASLLYEVSKSFDLFMGIEHTKKQYSSTPSTFAISNFGAYEVELNFSQFTPSLNARFRTKYFYLTGGVGYGFTTESAPWFQNTVNLKASIGHQIKITDKSKINVFLSDEYMTNSFSKTYANSRFNTIGLGIGFETSL